MLQRLCAPEWWGSWQAEEWCAQHYSKARPDARLKDAGQWGVPVGAELWVIRGRALHLAGEETVAVDLFKAALACKLASRDRLPPYYLAPAPPRLVANASGPASERGQGQVGPGVLGARLGGRLSERDVERLQRECRFNLQLIARLSSALQSAEQLQGQGQWARVLEMYNSALGMDPQNNVHCADVLALRAQLRLDAPPGSLPLPSQATMPCLGLHLALQDALRALARRAAAGGRGGGRGYMVLGRLAETMGDLDAAARNLSVALEAMPPAHQAEVW